MHRGFLRQTTNGLTDDQARLRTTGSEVTLGGLIKHVADVEEGWANFIVTVPSAMESNGKDWTEWGEQEWAKRAAAIQLQPNETLAGVLERYQRVADRTDQLVATIDWIPATRYRTHRGSPPAGAARLAVACCTSLPRPLSTPARPTSSGRRWMAPRPWADGSVRARSSKRCCPARSRRPTRAPRPPPGCAPPLDG